MNLKATWTRPGTRRRGATTPLSIALLATLLTGCATPKTVVREIPTNNWVTTVKAGQVFIVPVDGKFVPESRFVQMLDAFVRESDRNK